jgi:hypothetical protein
MGDATEHARSLQQGVYNPEAGTATTVVKGPLGSPNATITYHPLSLQVLALLMPASVFGTLARLGLVALTTYPGESIFSLAYVQGFGCLIMGFCLALKGPISDL